MPTPKSRVKSVAIIEDHSLYREALSELVNNIKGTNDEKLFSVVIDAENGAEFKDKFNRLAKPLDLVISDIKMPLMDGFETLKLINSFDSKIDVLILTFYDDSETILKFIKEGAKGFLTKDATPELIKKAILSIATKGYYYTDLVTSALIENLRTSNYSYGNTEKIINPTIALLSKREREILELFATELTYQEISDRLCISKRTIDAHKENMYRKLGVSSRIGLVMKALKNNFINSEAYENK